MSTVLGGRGGPLRGKGSLFEPLKNIWGVEVCIHSFLTGTKGGELTALSFKHLISG